MILSYVINIILPSNFVIANDIAYHNEDTFKLQTITKSWFETM